MDTAGERDTGAANQDNETVERKNYKVKHGQKPLKQEDMNIKTLNMRRLCQKGKQEKCLKTLQGRKRERNKEGNQNIITLNSDTDSDPIISQDMKVTVRTSHADRKRISSQY